MPLDPEVVKILAELEALGLPPIHTLSPTEARQQSIARAPAVNPELSAARVEDRKIPGPESLIPLRLYYPAGDGPHPTVVYFHGGGWVVGGIDTHDALCHELTTTSGCLVVSVDYRLAPEHPYPAAAEDAYAATEWVSENAKSIGADPGRLAVLGDSAGGNLATVVTLMARDLGGPAIRFQGLIYPITDRDFDRASYKDNAEGYGLTRDAMIWFWEHYAHDEQLRQEEHASPLLAESVADLPPALVITAEYDPLLDEGEAYAARLRESGVATQLTRYDGLIHGFFRMTARVEGARTAVAEVSDALREALGDRLPRA